MSGNVCVDICEQNFNIVNGKKICIDLCTDIFPLEVEGTGECVADCPTNMYKDDYNCNWTCKSGFFELHGEERRCVNNCTLRELINGLRLCVNKCPDTKLFAAQNGDCVASCPHN